MAKLFNQKKVNLLLKKKDEHSKYLFVEIDDREIKNYSYYSKKFAEAKNRDDSIRYARELIFHHLKKE